MKCWCVRLLGLFLGSRMAVSVQTQISIDATTNTPLNPIDSRSRIDEGDRPRDKLFHSFDRFSVLNGT